MKTKTLFPALILVLAMLACNFPSNVPVTVTPTLELFPTSTLVLSTDLPTLTPLPADTAPPPPTATPSVPVAFPRDVAVNCRLGPGTAWVVLSGLGIGQSSQITGRTNDGTWWNIVDPASAGRRCWVSASVVNTAGNMAGIPVVAAPSASVTNVQVSLTPRTISAPGCLGPILPIEIKGTIETNGPTTVTWRFETQQGGAMTNQTTQFDTFGAKDFSVDYTPPVAAGTYWVRLVVSSPNSTQAETSYTITCP
jgi:hypothetical protein